MLVRSSPGGAFSESLSRVDSVFSVRRSASWRSLSSSFSQALHVIRRPTLLFPLRLVPFLNRLIPAPLCENFAKPSRTQSGLSDSVWERKRLPTRHHCRYWVKGGSLHRGRISPPCRSSRPRRWKGKFVLLLLFLFLSCY